MGFDRKHTGMEETSDEMLMVRYQKGEEEGFNALFARHEGRLYNFFLRRLEDKSLSADLYQKTWFNVHRSRQRYDPQRPFRVWLFSVAYNVLKDEFKRRAASREIQADAALETTGRSIMSPVEHRLEQSETRAVLARAMKALPDGQREILLLSKYEGLGYPEIAEIMGLSVGAVKQKAHRAFLTLKSKLAGYMKEARH